MDKQIIWVAGDILSGRELPRRIEFVKSPTEDDSGFIVSCGHSLTSKMGYIGKAPFLVSHPELIKILEQMQVGDVAEKQDTTDGSQWIIKARNGVVRET